MNHLQELTQKIRTALPRLMQLEVGCIVSEAFETYRVIHMDSKGITVVNKNNEVLCYTSCEAKDLKIEGKEPMLNDVLEWINKEPRAGILDIMGFNGICQWNLSNPFLHQQDQETIEFLNKLK